MIHYLFYASLAYGIPIITNPATICGNPNSNGRSLNFLNEKGRADLLWTSVGLAVVTSFLQGIITTIVVIAEDQDMWTFRFRIARYEHWWWILVAGLLTSSFGLIILSFLSGNNNDSLGVLTLATATAIAIVRYAIPAWRNRQFIEARWLAWTGPSRTAINGGFGKYCGESAHWDEMLGLIPRNSIVAAPSDQWGWVYNPFNPPKGKWQDPTAIVMCFGENKSSLNIFNVGHLGKCVYDDGYEQDQVSLLWGQEQGFRRRVSRAINSMPRMLLNSKPFTFDGFNGNGLCLAMGILGRNKGLAPRELVFDVLDARKQTKGVIRNHPSSVSTELEGTSVWFPRSNKVMRSYYHKAMEEQYSRLGPEFIGAAVELALIFLDCPIDVIEKWLFFTLEQQSMDLNYLMSDRPTDGSSEHTRATHEQLQTLYRASYVSMVISINYFNQRNYGTGAPCRPDLICFALLWLSEGHGKPDWWDKSWVKNRLNAEMTSLAGNWWRAASWLLGLASVPPLLSNLPNWDDPKRLGGNDPRPAPSASTSTVVHGGGTEGIV